VCGIGRFIYALFSLLLSLFFLVLYDIYGSSSSSSSLNSLCTTTSSFRSELDSCATLEDHDTMEVRHSSAMYL
jgi:hypothetical protein